MSSSAVSVNLENEMKLVFAYFIVLSVILVWNYCAGQLNKKADKVMEDHVKELDRLKSAQFYSQD